MPHVPRNRPQPLAAALKRDLLVVQVSFGTRLRELRHEKEMTLENVAELADLSPNYIGTVERGERNVTLFNIWRIATSMGLEPAALLSDMPLRVPVGPKPKRKQKPSSKAA